jgi:hypothetical protein
VEFRKCPPRIAAGRAVDKAGQAAMIEAANRHGRERLVLASCRLRTRAAGAWPELAECRRAWCTDRPLAGYGKPGEWLIPLAPVAL